MGAPTRRERRLKFLEDRLVKLEDAYKLSSTDAQNARSDFIRLEIELLELRQEALANTGFFSIRTLLVNLQTANALQKAKIVRDAVIRKDRFLKRRPGSDMHGFLDGIGFFVPKSVREPFWREMLDDRDAMVKAGRTATFIRLAIGSQIVLLAVITAKDLLLKWAFGYPRTPGI